MDPNEILRIVDAIHRDRNIDREVVFDAIEAALVSLTKRHYGEEGDISVEIDRTAGSIRGARNGVPMNMAEIVERIGAQTAKEAMIQKIREADAQSTRYIVSVAEGDGSGCHAHACCGHVAVFPAVSTCPRQAWAWHPSFRNRNYIASIARLSHKTRHQITPQSLYNSAADNPHAVAVDAEPRRQAVAIRRAAVGGGVAPRAAAKHARRAGRRPRRVDRGRLLVVVPVVPIGAPLPDVAVHVVQSPGVRLLLAHRMRLAAGVALEPTVLRQLGFAIAKTIPRCRARAAGVFPLCLGRQAEVTPARRTSR